MKVLFFILRTEGDTCLILDAKELKISEIIICEINDACQRFIDNLVDQVKNQRDISTLSNVIIYIFGELSQFFMPSNDIGNAFENFDVLKMHMRMFFKLGIKIMAVDRLDVRLVLQNFLEKVGDEFIKL